MTQNSKKAKFRRQKSLLVLHHNFKPLHFHVEKCLLAEQTTPRGVNEREKLFLLRKKNNNKKLR